MADLIAQELAARGVADVLVILKRPPDVPASAWSRPAGTLAAADCGGAMKSIARHFVRSVHSLTSQLVAAARAGEAVQSSARLGLSRAQAVQAPPLGRYYPYLGVVLGTVDRAGLQWLHASRAVDEVVGVPPLELIRPERVASATLTSRHTWGLRDMNVPEVWAQGFDGRGVLVGHLDTGADAARPALRGALARFAEFDFLGRQVTPAPKAFDSDDHGTHTAGTLAGRPVRGRHIGVAPRARLASALVIEGGNVIARVLGGMDWAIGEGVRIVSMSLGFRGWWDEFVPLTRILRDRGILPVFAAGNEGAGTSRSPGNYSDAICVGAYDRRGDVTVFSSSQVFRRPQDPIVPDVVAPGDRVISARPGGGYQSMSGTSMATPHIAGLAALLMQAAPKVPADRIEEAILDSASLRPGMRPDRAGRGAPDAAKALGLVYTPGRRRRRLPRRKK